MTTLVLMKAMVKRYGIELRRYYFNTLSGLVTVYMIFLFIFLGARSFAGNTPGFGETHAALVVGFMIWFLALFAYDELSWVLIQEAQQGTLEQLSMSPLGFGRVLLSRILAALVFDIGIMLIFLVLMMASTGKWLHLDFLSIFPLLLLTVAGVLGIGFIMGGLALVFKQIEGSFQILQFMFVAMIAAPPERFSFAKYLPLSWGTNLIRRVMIEEASILEIPVGDLLFLVGNAVFYLGLGFAIFKFFEHQARDQGLLGHY
ncbi:MAG: ABC transporter permease [Candidatus Bipolaricaulia bacterium]